MASYDVTGHPMLADAAAQMSETELTAHATVAEVVLRISSTDFTPFDATTQADLYEKAQAAVALQVSFQAEAGIEAFVLSASRRGARSADYRKGSKNAPVVHPLAKRIASALRRAAGVTV